MKGRAAAFILAAAGLMGGTYTYEKPGGGKPRKCRDLDKPLPPPLTVEQIRFDREPKPVGQVKIWAWRKKAWRVSEPVDASEVQWSRLMKYDRVEVLDEQPADKPATD